MSDLGGQHCFSKTSFWWAACAHQHYLWLGPHYIEFPSLLVWLLVSLTQLGPVTWKIILERNTSYKIFCLHREETKNTKRAVSTASGILSMRFRKVLRASVFKSAVAMWPIQSNLPSSSIGPLANPNPVPERKVGSRLYFLYKVKIDKALRLVFELTEQFYTLFNFTSNNKKACTPNRSANLRVQSQHQHHWWLGAPKLLFRSGSFQIRHRVMFCSLTKRLIVWSPSGKLCRLKETAAVCST